MHMVDTSSCVIMLTSHTMSCASIRSFCYTSSTVVCRSWLRCALLWTYWYVNKLAVHERMNMSISRCVLDDIDTHAYMCMCMCMFSSLSLTDYQDSNLRKQKKNMEFVWRASPSLGRDAQVFTGAFYSGNYGPPVSDETCITPHRRMPWT